MKTLMRYDNLLSAVSAASTLPARVLAHGGLAGDTDPGHGIWWVYGILLSGLIAYPIYRLWRHGNETPARKALKRRLAELEHEAASCLTRLRNADDYPRECGLTDNERQECVDSLAAFRNLIEEAKSELAAPNLA